MANIHIDEIDRALLLWGIDDASEPLSCRRAGAILDKDPQLLAGVVDDERCLNAAGAVLDAAGGGAATLILSRDSYEGLDHALMCLDNPNAYEFAAPEGLSEEAFEQRISDLHQQLAGWDKP
jgi:hypothetical protein